MLPILSLLILALAVSLDGFGVGAMYGIRKIRMPIASVAIISSFSGIVIFISMQIGVLIAHVLSPSFARSVGAFILMGIGIWAVIQIKKQGKSKSGYTDAYADTDPANADPNTNADADVIRSVLHIELKNIGLVIQILKTPSAADVDRSGNISASEAVLLGLALSLDAFGAGIGAALIGFNPIITACVIAFSSGAFLTVGLRVGFIFSQVSWIHKLTFLPGCILIIMGIMKLL